MSGVWHYLEMKPCMNYAEGSEVGVLPRRGWRNEKTAGDTVDSFFTQQVESRCWSETHSYWDGGRDGKVQMFPSPA